MLVVRCKDETFGLLVDKIGDVLSVSAADFEPAPDNVSENARELVEGAYKLPDKLMLPVRLDRIAEISS
jgi:purine-binding chemotaxis protein CheW